MDSILSEDNLRTGVDLLVRLVEAAGALVIFGGAVIGFGRFLATAIRDRRSANFDAVRLTVGRFLALGLEFQLAADILRTAVTPSFTQIGQLAAVAAIRTALNFFLERDIRSGDRSTTGSSKAAASPSTASSPAGDL